MPLLLRGTFLSTNFFYALAKHFTNEVNELVPIP